MFKSLTVLGIMCVPMDFEHYCPNNSYGTLILTQFVLSKWQWVFSHSVLFKTPPKGPGAIGDALVLKNIYPSEAQGP